jgi:hypothetical protein
MRAFIITVGLLLAGATLAGENIPLQQAQKAGVKKCLPAVQKVSEFLLEGGNHGAHGTWNIARPDKQVYASMIERTFSDASQIFSLVVTPTVSGECPTVYERIAYFQESCIATAKNTLSNFEYKGELNKRVTIMSSKSGGDAYLMPIASGCLLVRREVIADGNNP